MVSLRLPLQLEKQLNAIAQSRRVPKSTIVREALEKHLKSIQLTPYQLAADLIETLPPGPPHLAGQRRTLLKQKLKTRHAKRSH